jgi:hypothetical protein
MTLTRISMVGGTSPESGSIDLQQFEGKAIPNRRLGVRWYGEEISPRYLDLY